MSTDQLQTAADGIAGITVAVICLAALYLCAVLIAAAVGLWKKGEDDE